MHSNLRAGVVLSIVRALQVDNLGIFSASASTLLIPPSKESSEKPENQSQIGGVQGNSRSSLVLKKPSFLCNMIREAIEQVKKTREAPPSAPEERKKKKSQKSQLVV